MKKIIIGLIVFSVLTGGIVSCGLLKNRGNKSADTEKKVSVVKRGDFQMRISATGNLEPRTDVEVKSNVAGEIVTLYVKEGNPVEQGDILLEIEQEEYEEARKQAKADVDAADAQLRQAELNIQLRKESLDSELRQAEDTVQIEKTNRLTTLATSLTQITQAETNIQTTENALSQDKIALEQANIAHNQAELTLSELEEALNSAKVALANAKSEVERNRELFEKKLVSKKSLEDAEARYASELSQNNSALQRVASQEKTVESQKKTIKVRDTAILTRKATLTYQELNLEKLREMRESEEAGADLRLKMTKTRLSELQETIVNEKLVTEQGKVSAEANVLRRKSNLKNEVERLGWTTIKAPMAGTVMMLEVEEGEIVTSGRSAFAQSLPLMTIADLSDMVVKTYINEVDMERLRKDQPAEIKADAYENKIYEGRVAEISPTGEERDNIITFEVMIEVTGSPSELRPGMSADVDVITHEEKNVLMLPVDAVQNNKSILITAQVGDDASDFKENQSVEVKNAGGKTFKGRITRIGGGELTISLDSSQRGLRPGQGVFAILVNGKQKLNGVSATIAEKSERFVMLDQGGASGGGKTGAKGKKVPVETGIQNAVDVIIKSGLVEGDRVILPPPKGRGPAGFGG